MIVAPGDGHYSYLVFCPIEAITEPRVLHIDSYPAIGHPTVVQNTLIPFIQAAVLPLCGLVSEMELAYTPHPTAPQQPEAPSLNKNLCAFSTLAFHQLALEAAALSLTLRVVDHIMEQTLSVQDYITCRCSSRTLVNKMVEQFKVVAP